MNNYVFTICGRDGSKGIPGKNSSLFLGTPLLYYTLAVIELYKASHPNDEITIALNTDSSNLKLLMDKSSIPYLYVQRDKVLSGDLVSKIDVIRATYNAIDSSIKSNLSAVVDLDITSPLRTLRDLETLLEMRENSDVGTIFTVVNSRRNPFFNMIMENDDGTCSRVLNSNFTTRQQAPQVFDMNASMYAYSESFMESDAEIFDWPCSFLVMKDTAVLDLDNPEDLELMQIIADYLFKTNKKMKAIKETAELIASRMNE